jgi:hypothetical protein
LKHVREHWEPVVDTVGVNQVLRILGAHCADRMVGLCYERDEIGVWKKWVIKWGGYPGRIEMGQNQGGEYETVKG